MKNFWLFTFSNGNFIYNKKGLYLGCNVAKNKKWRKRFSRNCLKFPDVFQKQA